MTVKSFWVLVLISLLFTACSRKNKNETQEVSQNNTEAQSTEDLLEGADFYVPALDNGDWVGTTGRKVTKDGYVWYEVYVLGAEDFGGWIAGSLIGF